MITSLKEKQVFVYGSNLGGINAGGAAKQAQEQFGAKEGVGEGFNGQCYAFPTLNADFSQRTKEELEKSRDLFFSVAENHWELEFLMTKVGCGIAQYSEYEMKELFKNPPKNVVLPVDWLDNMDYTEKLEAAERRGYEKGIVETEKAFGGCHKCYGKGYSTVRYVKEGFDDFGGEGFISPSRTNIHSCSCDRGKQIDSLIKETSRHAATEFLREYQEFYKKAHLLPDESFMQIISRRFTNWDK